MENSKSRVERRNRRLEKKGRKGKRNTRVIVVGWQRGGGGVGMRRGGKGVEGVMENDGKRGVGRG